MKKVRVSTAKDMALITAIIINEDMLNGSVLHTFDEAYEIANKFMLNYPEDYNWENSKKEFDETVIEFVKKIKSSRTQYDLMQQIIREAKVNLVDCECGEIILHEIKQNDILCPYCGINSEPCDFPDHFHNKNI